MKTPCPYGYGEQKKSNKHKARETGVYASSDFQRGMTFNRKMIFIYKL